MNFRSKLAAAQEKNDSWLCVGLDPDPAQMPPSASLVDFCLKVIEATADLVCAFKPNLAFFLAQGSEGIRALETTLKAVPAALPVVLDAKVGDIGSTQRMYGQAAFGQWGVDAITASPYVGEDAITPLLGEFPGRGVYVLCRSSNPDAPRFQDHPGRSPRLFEQVAEAAQGWARAYPESTVGLVVGATHPSELASLRRQAPQLPFLIPGVGAQGGEVESAVRHGATVDGLGPLINASRAVLYASKRGDYPEAARAVALRLRVEISRYKG